MFVQVITIRVLPILLMIATTDESTHFSNVVIFDSSSSSSTSTTVLSTQSILISCRDGLQKLTGHVKRGRPKKEHHTPPFSEHDDNPHPHEHASTSRFSFINYTTSPQEDGAHFQRLVRKRVMLNYRRHERELRKISENAESTKAESAADTPFQGANHNEKVVKYAAPISSVDFLPKEITAAEPFNAFPIKIESYMLERLSSYTTSVYETMYTIEKHVNINPAKDYWLPMAFQDVALLHAFLFCADGHGNLSQGRKESPNAVIHLRKAIQIVNERLRAPVPYITDATIAVVCTFAHMEVLTGNRDNWAVHMRGLRQMIQQRGGLEAFELNRLVRSKINRADLCGSIDLVQSPYFKFIARDLPMMPGCYQMTPITKGFGKIITSIKLNKALTQILCHISDITSNVNEFHHDEIRIHPLSLREAITSSQYSLLSLKPQQGNSIHDSMIHEMLRLGLLIYLISLLDEAPPGVSLYDMLGARLKSVLVQLRWNGGLDLKFSLWIMFIATSVVSNPDTKGFFMASATNVMEELGVSSWDNAETIFRSFFWVEKIYRVTLRPIWDTLKAAKPFSCRDE